MSNLIDAVVSRVEAELVTLVKDRIARVDKDIQRIKSTIALAQKFKPELATESEELLVKLTSERQELESDLNILLPGEEVQIKVSIECPEKPPTPEVKPSAPPVIPPKPPIAPPQAPTVDRKQLAIQFNSTVEDLMLRTRLLISRDVCDERGYYEVRILTADTRGAMLQLRESGLTSLHERLDYAMGDLIAWCTSQGERTGYVYGVSRASGYGTIESWAALSMAWKSLAIAQFTWKDLVANKYVHPKADYIATLCLRAGMVFNETCTEYSLDIRDNPRTNMVEAIQDTIRRNKLKNVYTPEIGLFTAEKIIEELSSVTFEVQVVESIVEEEIDSEPVPTAQELRAEVMSDLKAALVNPGACELLMLVEKAFTLGIAPSNKELRTLLAPVRDMLPPRTRKGQYSKLVEYLASDANTTPGAMVPEDTTNLKIVPEEILAITRGKRMLFLGGQMLVETQKALVKAFELEALEWPSTNNATKLPFLMPYVPKADIVVRLPRWSHHAFKAALDEAKKLGKLTIDLPGGFGVNNIAHCIREQALGSR